MLARQDEAELALGNLETRDPALVEEAPAQALLEAMQTLLMVMETEEAGQ